MAENVSRKVGAADEYERQHLLSATNTIPA